jgi:hypothetical protein
LIALARLFGTSLGRALPGKGFGMFAPKAQNGFVGCRNCFVAVSRETFFVAACLGNRDFNDRIYPFVAISDVQSHIPDLDEVTLISGNHKWVLRPSFETAARGLLRMRS